MDDVKQRAGRPFYLSSRERNEMIEGLWFVDSLAMSLRRRDGKRTYTGVGHIELAPSGGVQFSLLDADTELSLLDFPTSYEPGKLIPQTDFFDLEAVDTLGRLWWAVDIQPSISHDAEKGVVARGFAWRMHTKAPVPELESGKPDSLWLHMPGDIEFPTSEPHRIVEKIRDREVKRSMRYNSWAFEVDDWRFHLERAPKGLTVSVRSQDTPLPQGFDTRIEECLWLILGQQVSWNVLSERRSGVRRVAIRQSPYTLRRPRLGPPVELSHRDAASHCADLFADYLRFITANEDAAYHPLSVRVGTVLRSSALSIQEEAVALSIEIEGLVKDHFHSLGAAAEDVTAEAERLEKLVMRCRGLPKTRQRLLGAIRSFRGANPRTALRTLVDSRVIQEHHRKAWESTRPRVTHGSQPKGTVAEMMNNNNTLHQMFLLLLFRVIGYEGVFSDRLAKGWPFSQVRDPKLSLTQA